jgi:membrane protease YdiL (CAAX protease family)
MTAWFKTAEDLPTTRLVLLVFCGLLAVQGPIGNFTLHYSLGWGLLLNQLGIMLAPVVLICWRMQMDTDILFPLRKVDRRTWRWVVFTSICIIVISDLALSLTESAFSVPIQIQETLNQLLVVHGAGDFFKKLFLFCILPSVAEELYFRGFIQTSLSYRMGIQPAILLTALLFALAHGNMWYLHLYFGLGFFLGWIYEKSGSLWPPIVAHFLNNTWTFISHMMGWTDVLGNAWLVQLAGLVVLLGILIWGLGRWGHLKTVAR